jgi:hypothetical protein
MRPRIRSLKPEIHTDEELWDLEVASGMPLYRAYTGLWNYSDREGRFEWRPRALKAMILPYWDGDFDRALDALARGRFIVKYTVGGKHYGWVRTLKVHQSFNAREPESVLPAPPPEVLHVHARAAHVTASGELELELEGNGAGSELSVPRAHPRVATPGPELEPDTSVPPAPAVANDLAPPEPSRARATGRTFEMPSGPPPQEYLGEAWIAGVSREQATSTWEHYQRAKLPLKGVERLHPWLIAQAATYARNNPTPPARASPRGRQYGSKQPNAGMTGLEGVEIVNGIAVPRLRPAEESPG